MNKATLKRARRTARWLADRAGGYEARVARIGALAVPMRGPNDLVPQRDPRVRAMLARACTPTRPLTFPRLRAAVEQAAQAARRAPLALLLAVCLLLAGCVAPEAIEQARHEAAICHGHAADTGLPLEARQIAADETRAWRAQHLALTGDDVPGAAAWPALPSELDAVTGGAPAVEAPR